MKNMETTGIFKNNLILISNRLYSLIHLEEKNVVNPW
jgi:hypothetical protein